MGDDFITLDEAAELTGLHKNSLARLLRQGVLRGHKMKWQGRMRWLVSVRALRQYADPIDGFLLDMPGPKLFLRRVEEDDEDEGRG